MHDRTARRRKRLFVRVAVAFAIATGGALLSTHAQPTPFSHYQSILDRAPFGPPPAPPPEATEPAEEPPPAEPLYIIPPGLDQIKVSLLSRFNGIPAAGFTDGETGTPYYLLEGQSFEEFTLLNVDLQQATILLRRGGYETELPLWINPATTNQADVATFGMLAASTPPEVAASRVTPARSRTISAEEQRRIEELRKRREEARKKREAQRKAHAEEMAKLTPEEREQRLRDINVDIIINDSGPPLPIELNKKDMKKLHEAGFEVPGLDTD